ncbi:MAG: tetraacyldisaccharide 4'-kinase, partial [Thermoguttaceae bacterium]|nr:tetraacyldisaccharide 4'-kinase [Thermoguttaceae bacterium]
MRKTLLPTVYVTRYAQNCAAFLIAFPYSVAVRVRNILYDIGILRSRAAARPTIAVGNLTLGGVGKTPLVARLAEIFLKHGAQSGFISRGYKASAHRDLFARIDALSGAQILVNPPDFPPLNDEGRELAARMPTVPHYQTPDRVAAAAAL